MAEEPATKSPLLVLGSLGEFDHWTKGIMLYLECMQLYFEANSVDDDWRVAVLLTVIGAKTYETIRSLLTPALSNNQLIEVLKIPSH